MLPEEDEILAASEVSGLRNIYERLKSARSKKALAKRGHLLETLVMRLLQISGGWSQVVRCEKTASGELDVFGVYKNTDFVFEVKWTKEKTGRPILQKFESLLSHKSNVYGVLITIGKQTGEAAEWAKKANSRGNVIVLFDGHDIEAILDGKIHFNYLLEKRLHNAKFNQQSQEPSIEACITQFQQNGGNVLFRDGSTMVNDCKACNLFGGRQQILIRMTRLMRYELLKVDEHKIPVLANQLGLSDKALFRILEQTECVDVEMFERIASISGLCIQEALGSPNFNDETKKYWHERYSQKSPLVITGVTGDCVSIPAASAITLEMYVTLVAIAELKSNR